MVIKLCAAVAISKHGTIDRAVVVGLYPGALDEVDKVLNQLIDLRLLTCISATRLNARFEFFHKVRYQERSSHAIALPQKESLRQLRADH